MTLFGKNISSDRLTRWLFILTFFGIWFAAPLILFDDRADFFIKILPATLTNIPLFFLSTEWLAPRLLRKRGISAYLFSLLGLALVFIVLQAFMKNWLLSSHPALHHKGVFFHAYKALSPVLLVTAVSAGYAMVVHMLEGEKIVREERQERLQSELSFLRSQISPHFIFNILNSIVYLIRSKSDLAEPVTIKLSELMRYMLYESNDAQIPLEKEVSYLENYVELQKIRFEEDVEIYLTIEGESAGQLIEPMLLIPFVENAFKHGVGLVASPVIDIDLKFNEKEMTFKVRNKITPEMQADKDSSSGIGMQNVRRRLELLYPEAHRLELNRTKEWFVAELWLAFNRG